MFPVNPRFNLNTALASVLQSGVGTGIQEVGEEAAKYIAKYFKNQDAIANATFEELMQVPDIGPVTANNVSIFSRTQKTGKLLQKLLKQGLTGNMKTMNPPNNKSLLVKLGFNRHIAADDTR